MTGWKEHPSQQKAKAKGSATISFKDIQKQFGNPNNWFFCLLYLYIYSQTHLFCHIIYDENLIFCFLVKFLERPFSMLIDINCIHSIILDLKGCKLWLRIWFVNLIILHEKSCLIPCISLAYSFLFCQVRSRSTPTSYGPTH